MKGSKISTDFVDGDGSREGKALEDWLFIIDLCEFFIDLAIRPEAEFEDFAANSYLFKESTENICM